jgi:Protease inhibitor Inh
MRRLIPIALVAVTLSACASEQAVTGGPTRGATPEPMGGRWMFAAVGGSQCVMNLGGAADAPEGTIAPEGGCPGNFYTSRKWTFESGTIVVRDHKGAPLGQLTLAAPGRFEGKAANEQPVTLTR